MNDGDGLVVFDYIVTLLLWLAVLMQAAARRDHSICETVFAESCRWLILAGVLGIALRFTFVLYDSGDINLSPIGMASLGVMAIGLIGRPLEQLMREPDHRRFDDAPILSRGQR